MLCNTASNDLVLALNTQAATIMAKAKVPTVDPYVHSCRVASGNSLG
jgi:hypothetical protein